MCPRQQLQPAQCQHCLKQSWLFPEISITLLYEVESATSFPGFYHHTVESVDHLTCERITFKVDTILRDNAVTTIRGTLPPGWGRQWWWWGCPPLPPTTARPSGWKRAGWEQGLPGSETEVENIKLKKSTSEDLPRSLPALGWWDRPKEAEAVADRAWHQDIMIKIIPISHPKKAQTEIPLS